MKNIFKMMLVAVAAISLAACTSEQEMGVDVNTSKSTTVKLCLGFDATRSEFSGTNDAGTAYVSRFVGDESFYYHHDAPDSTDPLGNPLIYDKEGVISPELSGEVIYPEISLLDPFGGTFRICSPSASATASSAGFTCAIPQRQTPQAESCDPEAHVLFGEYTWSGELTSPMPITMQHYGAYGRMTLNGLADIMLEGEVISEVIVSINGANYILDPTNVVDNVFWFACYEYLTPASVTVSVNTLNGEDAGRSYVKELNIAGTDFSFEQGKVTRFKVGMANADIIDAPVVVAEHILTSVSYNATQGRFEFVNEHGDFLYVILNKEDRPDNNSIKPGTYKWSNDGSPAVGEFRINRFNFDDQEYTIYGEMVTRETATMEVTINEDGRYIITFYYELGYGILKIPFDVGYSEQEDMDLVPYREQLAAPEPEASIDGTNVVVTWEKVANANDYTLTIWGEGINETVDSVGDVDTYTFEGLTLTDGQEYTVSVTAHDTTGAYRSSVKVEAKVTYTAGGSGGGGSGSGDTSATDPWTFSYESAGSVFSRTVTFTGTGANTDKIVIGPGVFIDGSTITISNNVTVKLNGETVNVADRSGSFTLNQGGTATIDITIKGVKYTGTSTK